MDFDGCKSNSVENGIASTSADKIDKESRRNQKKKPEYERVVKNSQLITYEYLPHYKSYIPMAAGFRAVSKREALKIARRLNKPNRKSQGPENEADSRNRSNKPLRGKQYDVQRLVLPTVASEVRHIMRGGGGNRRMDVREVANVCDRLYLSPSQRYYPLAYENWLDKNSSKWSIESRNRKPSSNSTLSCTEYRPLKYKHVHYL